MFGLRVHRLEEIHEESLKIMLIVPGLTIGMEMADALKIIREYLKEQEDRWESNNETK